MKNVSELRKSNGEAFEDDFQMLTAKEIAITYKIKNT